MDVMAITKTTFEAWEETGMKNQSAGFLRARATCAVLEAWRADYNNDRVKRELIVKSVN